jgi:RNA polymerase sigma-70 factor (TIGR02957 family)
MTETADLEALRPGAFAIAYRMLGSVAEAEDVVQEAMLRLHAAAADPDASPIESPRAWLSTVVSRLALDELRSARARREVYVGEWLPEPLVGVGAGEAVADDPATEAETADSLSLAFLVLLESLTPEQRAAFLLHDVFDYPFDEVAKIIDTSPANARQLASRARREVEERRPRFDSSTERRDRLADRFFAAVGEGDLAGLEAMLAQDVELHGDGGGKVPALARPISGRVRAARTLRAWAKAGAKMGEVRLERVGVNGQPGAVFKVDGAVISVMSLEIADGQIQAIRSIVNPEKLTHLT